MDRKGAVGALLDVYEQVIADLKKTISDIPDDALIALIDPGASDENCRSIQAILSHVVNAGYGYATSIRNIHENTNTKRPDKSFHISIQDYLDGLDNVFAYTENVFREIKDHELEQSDDSQKIHTSWGQAYDIEQLCEHAIVHILRHKRQIEKFKLAYFSENNISVEQKR